MKRSSLLALFFIVAGAAGAAGAASSASPASPADTTGAAAKLNKLYADFWEENLKMNPLNATQAGDPRYNAELPNFLSKSYEDANRAFERKYLDAARAIGP